MLCAFRIVDLAQQDGGVSDPESLSPARGDPGNPSLAEKVG